MIEDNLRVYVSSTVLDLERERRAVLDWLRRARYQAVDSYLPNSESVRESCLADIEACHLYVLIQGWRYGLQPEDGNPDGLSITHLEFREAGRLGIPRIALLHQGASDVRNSDLPNPDRASRVFAFRDEVAKAARASEFADLHGLVEALSTGIKGELDKLKGVGRGSRGWLAIHAQELDRRFADHMTHIAPNVRPEDLYLDLVVSEQLTERPDSAESEMAARPLAEVMAQATSPVLLTGEGGAGKTASLLHLAAQGARRALADPNLSVPIYVNLAHLTRLDDMADLRSLIVDSVPMVEEWKELMRLEELRERRVVYLFDSLNELPESMQSTAVTILDRFMRKRRVLIASRQSTAVEQLELVSKECRTFEILELETDQVERFLTRLDLGPLYKRMPDELRELAGNPFLLVAIARTLVARERQDMPRNRGRLYEQFVLGWMNNEEGRRHTLYHYERVKQPLLAHLATRMTSLGRTSVALDAKLEEEIEVQLRSIEARISRLGGMPKRWSVDECLAEIVDDGLLRKRNGELGFLHQSVQEYFTAVHLKQGGPVRLAELVPVFLLDQVQEYPLPDVPAHRLVPVLLLMTGLLEDATAVVEVLASRHPVVAAACIASANRVNPATVERLTVQWLNLLANENAHRRALACSALARTGRLDSRVIERLVAMAISMDFDERRTADSALRQVNSPRRLVRAVVDNFLKSDQDLDWVGHRAVEILKFLPGAVVVDVIMTRWSTVAKSADHQRLGTLLAAVPEPKRSEEVHTWVATHRPGLHTIAEHALAQAGEHYNYRRYLARKSRELRNRGVERTTAVRSMSDVEVATHIASDHADERAAAIHESVIEATLHDENDAVRDAGADALTWVSTKDIEPMTAALRSDDISARVAAGAALAKSEDSALRADVIDAMREVAVGYGELAIRRRAGEVLASIPDGLEPIYESIEGELDRSDPHRALERIDAMLDVLPSDFNLHWWRGHALRLLERRDDAAESYQRAAELDDANVAVVLKDLAETLLDLHHINQAVINARRSIALDPDDADAHAILARCSYWAGELSECISAAGDALDRDPVHPTAIWTLLLGMLRRGDLDGARNALRQAKGIREILFLEPDSKFVSDALELLPPPADRETTLLIDEVRSTVIAG